METKRCSKCYQLYTGADCGVCSYRVQIGTYTLTEAREFQVPQEYAGAAQTVRVEAGVYPVEVRMTQYGRKWVAIPMPGTLVFDAFYNRIGACGSMKVERPMTATQHTLQPYGYELATMKGVSLSAPVPTEVF